MTQKKKEPGKPKVPARRTTVKVLSIRGKKYIIQTMRKVKKQNRFAEWRQGVFKKGGRHHPTRKKKRQPINRMADHDSKMPRRQFSRKNSKKLTDGKRKNQDKPKHHRNFPWESSKKKRGAGNVLQEGRGKGQKGGHLK